MAAIVEFTSQPARNVRSRSRVQVAGHPGLATHPGLTTHPGLATEPSAPTVGGPALVAIVVAVTMAACLLWTSGVLRSDDHVVPGTVESAGQTYTRSGDYVVVGPGDTLRSVAADYAPGADLVQVVEAIRVLNGAERSVEVGQVLALPALG